MIRSLDRKDAKVVPIIAMTANAFTEDRLKAKEAGMDEHIAKPVDVKLLVKVISRLVENSFCPAEPPRLLAGYKQAITSIISYLRKVIC